MGIPMKEVTLIVEIFFYTCPWFSVISLSVDTAKTKCFDSELLWVNSVCSIKESKWYFNEHNYLFQGYFLFKTLFFHVQGRYHNYEFLVTINWLCVRRLILALWMWTFGRPFFSQILGWLFIFHHVTAISKLVASTSCVTIEKTAGISVWCQIVAIHSFVIWQRISSIMIVP